MLVVRMGSMGSVQQLREQARLRGIKNGYMELAEGHLAHLLDAAELGRELVTKSPKTL